MFSHLWFLDTFRDSLILYEHVSWSNMFILQAYAAAGTLNQNYANILLMLLRLRQACDHPLLGMGVKSDSIGRDSVQMVKNLPRDMLINLMKHLDPFSAICCVCNVSSSVFYLFPMCLPQTRYSYPLLWCLIMHFFLDKCEEAFLVLK